MKVSIVTVVYNGEAFIETAIRSVLEQDYPDIEYIVVDGASKDGTMAIIGRYRSKIATVISEKDSGIYNAMNKGLRLATGDLVGILNADDFYAGPQVISKVVKALEASGKDTLYADLVYVNPDNLDKVVRYYSANNFRLKHFERGDMPPHPTFFVKRSLYEAFGLFKEDYKICADFELMVRFLYIQKASSTYLPEVLVKMRTGGVSTEGFQSRVTVNKEMQRALRENGIHSSILKIWSKYFYKIFQLFRRPA
ncbi:MAG: glycosyltransferase [Bacteroidia bacterium]|nr:glycosyltransferase [Bacteroidia bacterium]